MKKAHLSLFTIFAATPALAQDAAAQALGSGLGFLIGLAIMIVVGAVVGWLASLIVKGGGSGFWTDVLVGIGGSIMAGYLLPVFGLNFGSGVVGAFVPAIIGAVLLLLIIRLIRRVAG